MNKKIRKNASMRIGKYKLGSIYSKRLDRYSVRIVKRKKEGWGFSSMLYMGHWPADGGNTSHETAMRNVFQDFRQSQHTGEPTPMMTQVYI